MNWAIYKRINHLPAIVDVILMLIVTFTLLDGAAAYGSSDANTTPTVRWQSELLFLLCTSTQVATHNTRLKHSMPYLPCHWNICCINFSPILVQLKFTYVANTVKFKYCPRSCLWAGGLSRHWLESYVKVTQNAFLRKSIWWEELSTR